MISFAIEYKLRKVDKSVCCGRRIAGISRQFQQTGGLCLILFNPQPLAIEHTEGKLSLRQSLFSRGAAPADELAAIHGHALTQRRLAGQIELGHRVTGLRLA